MNILNKFFEINLKEFKKKFFFASLWISIFFSLNINPEDFYELSLIKIFFLTIPPLTLLFYFIYNFKKNIICIFEDKFLNFFAFTVYYILGILFIIINSDINSLSNIFWGVLMLSSFLYIYSFKNNSKQLRIFLICSLIVIFLVFFYYFFQILNSFILNNKLIHLYGISSPNFNYNNLLNLPPRSSGLSRMSLVLAISFIIYLITNSKKNYLTNLIFIFAIFLSTMGLAFQSRTMNFIFIIFSIFLIIIFFKKKNLHNKKYIFFLIVIPIVLSSTTVFFSAKTSNDPQYTDLIKNNLILKDNFNEKIIFLKKTLVRSTEGDFSSGRFNLWYKAVEISKKNNFSGFGFQADRKLLKESIHNVYLYALLCGGLVSMFLIIYISLRASFTSFFIFTNYLLSKKNYSTFDLIPAFLLPLFLLRGLLETSYGIYSIDYLFFIVCFLINELNYKKI